MDKKIISDEEVQNGISSGKFKEDGAIIRNIENGQIVKHQHNDNPNSIIPSSLIQVNHSYIYINNIDDIYNNIVNINSDNILGNLQVEFKTVQDKLSLYLTYRQEEYFTDLFKYIIKPLNNFQNELNQQLNIFKDKCNILVINHQDNYAHNHEIIRDLQKIELLSEQYLSIMLLYVCSSFKLHEKSLFIQDSLATNKIIDLKEKIQNIYEDLLMSNTSFNNSIYVHYFVNTNYNLDDIYKYIRYDRRYTVMELVSLLKQSFYKNNSSRNGNGDYNIYINTNNIHNRKNIIDKLYIILEDIENLEKIHEELKDDSFDNSDYEHIIKAIMQR